MLAKILISILIPIFVFGSDSNLTNPFPKATIVKDNLPPETNDDNITNWGAQDWNKYFVGKGADNSIAGNAQLMMGNSVESNIAYKQDPNLVTTDALKANPDTKDMNDIKAWDNKDQSDVLTKSLNNNYVSVLDISDKIECYITRDISFQYKCLSTGLIYGGQIQKSGRDARLKCEQDCYEQKSCVNVNPQAAATSIAMPNITCDLSKVPSCSKSISLDEKKIINNITINFKDKLADKDSADQSMEYLITIILSHTDKSATSVVSNFRRSFTENNSTINVDDTASSISVTIKRYSDNANVIATLNNLQIHYKKDDKFICRYLQNMNDIDGKAFAYNCAGGNIETFTYNGENYKICNDGMLGADNPDGTFSNEESCLSVCKISQSCVPAFNSFTTNSLKTFREGCIEGEVGCSNANEDCRTARLKGDTILDETVFDATANKTTTIRSGVAVKGVTRPRIDPGADADFQRENENEWKDEAFKDMATNSKYSFVQTPIGSDTQQESAYAIYFTSGLNYGVSDSSTRTLYWKLKPASFDVNNDQNYYLYAVIVADISYHGYDTNAQIEQKKKQIWYIKTSPDDTFKAIKIGLDLGYNGFDEDNNSITTNIASSQLENKSFSSNSWHSYSTSSLAEYFKVQKFEDSELPYWKFSIVSKLGNMIYKLPGMVRSITQDNDAYDIKHYDGYFDGTGDGLLTFTVYTYYSHSKLTYAELFNKIENNETNKIYKQGEEYLYKKELLGDSNDNSVAKLFQYGQASKTTLKTIIHPRKEDVGKKGFIFVFVQ